MRFSRVRHPTIAHVGAQPWWPTGSPNRRFVDNIPPDSMSGPGAAERYTIPGNVTLVGLNFGPDVTPPPDGPKKELPRHMALSTVFDPPSEVGGGTRGGKWVREHVGGSG